MFHTLVMSTLGLTTMLALALPSMAYAAGTGCLSAPLPTIPTPPVFSVDVQRFSGDRMHFDAWRVSCPGGGAIALLRVTPLTSGPFLCSLDFHVLQGSQQFDIHLTDEAETFSFCDNLFVSRTFFVAPASSQAAYNDDNDFTLIYDQGSGNPRFATLAVSGGPAGAAIVLGVNRDFNGDGKADILWRHSSGAVYIWLMDGASVIGQGSPGSVGTDWTVEAVADFNGDGKADILWRHSSGVVYIWLMNGTAVSTAGSPGSVGLDWTIQTVADFNGDGKADILWRHSSGAVYIWHMNGTSVSSVGSAGSVGLDWTVQ